jgi:hypothetical protein
MREGGILAIFLFFLVGLTSLVGPGLSQAQAECTNLSGLVEGDVYPVFEIGFDGGDSEIRFLDWQILLHLVVGLRTPISDCELAVADCAPRATRGDGLITTADVVQDFLWAGGLTHPVPPAGGPTNVVPTTPLPGQGARSVQFSEGQFIRGAVSEVMVKMNSAGDEFAIGFTLDFNPAELRLLSATSSLTNTFLYFNPFAITNGRLALVLLSDVFGPAIAGNCVKLAFQVVDWTATNATLTFSDGIVRREICNTNADPLIATFESASFEIVTRHPQLTALGVNGSNFDYQLVGELGGHYVIEVSTNLADWSPLLNFTNHAATNLLSDSIPSATARKFYRAVLLP